MPHLSFISDADLESAVENLLIVAQDALKKAGVGRNKNVIDPFSALFEMAGFGLGEESWWEKEKARQAQKTLGNHVGAFHQKILGKVKGWRDANVGKIIDLESLKHKIIAEIKNKHNTVSGGKLKDIYIDLEALVMPKHSSYKGFTAYYVEIVPKKSSRFDVPFTPSDKSSGSHKPSNDLIRKIDGFSFYEKVTGEKDALLKLFQALPNVIESLPSARGYKFQNRKFLDKFFALAYRD